MPSRRNKKKSSGNPDRALVSSTHAASSADIVHDLADFKRKPASWLISQRPPKSVQNMIYWMQTSYLYNIALSASGAVTEYAKGFALSDFPDGVSAASLFDQYCLYSVAARAWVEPTAANAIPVNSSLGRIHSAIDFDSSGNYGTEAAIMRVGSCQSSELVYGKSYERFVKPTVQTITGSSNSTSVSGTSSSRSWINSAFQAVPHFGIRYLTAGNSNVATVPLFFAVTAIIGFRNNI
jgi:hypothetical protein